LWDTTYKIYILGQKFIEVSRDVTFHEEAAFRWARELPCYSEEQEAPPLDSPDSPLPDEQREETSELLVDPSRDTIKFPMEIAPVKRKPASCGEILKEDEKHSAPKGTFRESKKPDKYYGPVLPEVGASEASFSKNPQKRSIREASVIYTYNFLYILHLYSKKYVERQISCRIYENMHICTSI
jgi:hypothetical protein